MYVPKKHTCSIALSLIMSNTDNNYYYFNAIIPFPLCFKNYTMHRPVIILVTSF